MPDRVVRDELLTSERYWRCSPEARNLYLSIILSVDDAARMTGSPFALRTRCMASTVSHERIEVILAELVDADLVRRYESDGRSFLFVPRFRNRRRYYGASKNPEPPKEINDMIFAELDSSQARDGLKSDPSQTQDRRRGVGVGEERVNPRAPPPRVDPQIWAEWLQTRGSKLTDIAYRKQVSFLDQQPNPDACIEQSLRNAWAGLFEFRGEPVAVLPPDRKFQL